MFKLAKNDNLAHSEMMVRLPDKAETLAYA